MTKTHMTKTHMTKTHPTTTPPTIPDNDALVARALSTVGAARAADDLADRAFAAAMRAPQASSLSSTVSDLFGELFAVARIGAVCAAGVAAILLVVSSTSAATTTASTTSSTLFASADDEWISAVLPLALTEEAL